ncbi:MAG TPA: hypothetical protein VKB36_11625, partial [Vicinamibacterales bacterium]|nr:hypothetical protein [Vicinamibacterales bacterium]
GRRRVRIWFRSCYGGGVSRIVGRSLAMCLHPYATWRSQPTRFRVLVLLAYTIAGYALVLGGLYAAN